jgi:MurNAc alpha-1-phosphate uridylyltransferase
LRPLTDVTPKPLLPVAGVPLLDLAIARLAPYVDEIAVNAHYLHEQITAHVAGRGIHVSIEEPEALGTAGALGHLREWIDGRDVLLTNGDVWYSNALRDLNDGGNRMRLLVVPADDRRADYGEWLYAGTCYLPWEYVRVLPDAPAGLHEVCWRDAWATNSLDLVPYAGQYIDCGTPQNYQAANLAAERGHG